MNNSPRRAGIYVRVSKNRQDDRAKPDRQKARCEALATAREHEVVEVYTDDDVSAYKGSAPPNRDRLWSDLRAGRLDTVITLHMDRFLRSTADMLAFIDLARETGAELHTVESGTLDLSTSAGKLVATILAAVAEAESERKAERHVLRNQQAVRQGKSLGGPPPFGWGATSNLHDTDGPLLQAGIRAYLEGTSLGAIARQWNEAGATTIFGNTWDHTSVRKVLVRPRNAGLVEYRGDVLEDVKAEWEPACTPDEWRAVVAIAKGQGRPGRPRTHLLTNLIHCARCGNPMVSATAANGKYRYRIYRCTSKGGCRTSVRLHSLEEAVRTQVRLRLTFGDSASLAPSSLSVEQAIALRTERANLHAKQSELEDLWAAGEFGTQSYRKHRAKLEDQVTALSEQLAVIEKDNAFAAMLAERVEVDAPIKTAAAIGKRFDALDLDHRRTIVKALFERIEVTPAKSSRAPIEERIVYTLPGGSRYIPRDGDEGVPDMREREAAV